MPSDLLFTVRSKLMLQLTKAKKTPAVANKEAERAAAGLAAICEKTAQFLASFYYQVNHFCDLHQHDKTSVSELSLMMSPVSSNV